MSAGVRVSGSDRWMESSVTKFAVSFRFLLRKSLRLSLRARILGLLAIFALIAVPKPAFSGEPYVPKSDSEVIERLPRGLVIGQRNLAKLQQALRADSMNVAVAADLATSYLEIGAEDGDPRYFGYAQAALQPWWTLEHPPLAVLKLRAELLEKDHRYDEALADLQQVVEETPEDVQAWIEISNIMRLKGDYKAALVARDRLSAFAGSFPVMMCQAPIFAVTGQAETAYAALAPIPPSAKSRLGDAYQWVLHMRAELARILGRDQLAEIHFREAIGNMPAHFFSLRAFADFLLDQGRPAEAFELIRDHTGDNGLLLRAAIAARQMGELQAGQRLRDQLSDRFKEMRLRGGSPHGRFESRFALQVEDDPDRALNLALATWSSQKETRDARNVLEAAIAAAQPAAAQQVIDFLMHHGHEDVVLHRLMQQVEAMQ